MENIMDILQKIKIRTTVWSSNLTSWHISKKPEIKIPDVRGLTETQAEAKLIKKGFKVADEVAILTMEAGVSKRSELYS